MKPLLILLRISLVGLCWSIFFIEGIRVILLTNWHFDIFRQTHWLHAWNLWLSGWIIDEPKEWAFVLIIITALPVWITVWAALSSLRWGLLFSFLSTLPFKVFNRLFGQQVEKITASASVKVVKKKKSYKEIRPKSIRPPLEESSIRNISAFDQNRKAVLSGISVPQKASIPLPQTPAPEPKEFSHSLFDLGDTDPVDFDLFAEPSVPQTTPNVETPSSREENASPSSQESSYHPAPKTAFQNKPSQNKQKSGSVNSSFEIIKQKGYEVITGATIKNTFIDFVGVSKNQICLCLNDKEPGDWLADEERFNDEEPLWFSESSHRISPVRKISLAREILDEELKKAELSFEITPLVIEQIGNIINAEDMFDIWSDLGVKVTRIDRGTPKEIPLFAKTLEEADGSVDKAVLDKIKKLIRRLA